ncbi:MAG TPA: T9SS type A sorting domain-containing protein [Candidatus Eisenbacteria bacterium]
MKSPASFHALVVLPLLLSSAPSICSADWPTEGLPVCSAPHDQLNPAIAPDGLGGCFIAWQDHRDGLQFDIYLQHVTTSGALAPGWPENGLAVCTAAGDQIDPQVVADGFGGAILTWSDARDGAPHIYAQRVAASGAIAAGWIADGVPVCLADVGQETPSAAPDGAGGAIIAWADGRNHEWDIAAQHVLGSGVVDPGWPVNGELVCAAVGDQRHPRALPDGGGGAFVLWGDQRAVSQVGCGGYPFCHDVFLERILPDGSLAPGWTLWGNPVSPLVGFKDSERMVPDGAGGVLVGWIDSSFGMVAQRFGPGGVTVPGWPSEGAVLCAAGSIFGSGIAPDGQGGAIAAWNIGDVVRGVRARHVRANGLPLGDPCGAVLTPSAGYIDDPSIVADGAGGAFVVWTDVNLFNNLAGLRITDAGLPAPGWPAGGMAIGPGAGRQVTPVIAADGFGGALCAWIDYRNSHTSVSNADIYAQLLGPGGATAIEIALASAEVREGLVRVEWFSAAGAGITATVYRSSVAGEWEALGHVLTDGSGRMAYEDRTVSAGGRYGYRVGVQEAGGEHFYGETWVDVPAAAGALWLRSGPNPSRGALTASFNLPGGGPARLEVFDAAGRCVVSRDVGVLGPGPHALTLGEAPHLLSGIYMIRLTQGGRSASARGVIVR